MNIRDALFSASPYVIQNGCGWGRGGVGGWEAGCRGVVTQWGDSGRREPQQVRALGMGMGTTNMFSSRMFTVQFEVADTEVCDAQRRQKQARHNASYSRSVSKIKDTTKTNEQPDVVKRTSI